jgi:hypothetical protein
MEKKEILKAVLSGQDLGGKSVTEACDSVINNVRERVKDPITDVIVNALQDNDWLANESSKEMAVSDLEYAITQLERAKKKINEMI